MTVESVSMTQPEYIARSILTVFAVSLCVLSSPLPASYAQEIDKPVPTPARPIVGWAEKALVYPGAILMHAKMAPGDESTSIHATSIESFRKKKSDWVRFVLTDRTGKEHILEREVLREVKIKSRGKQKSVKKKYLIHLGFCVGKVREEAEVRLSDRSSRQHSIIMGRNVLAGNVVLDPSRSFVSKPECDNISKES